MKSTLMKKIGAALVVGMMAIGSVAPASAQESIMGNRRDNAESYNDGPRLYNSGFYGGRGYNRGFRGYGGYGGYNRGFRGYGGYGGYNRPFYGYNRPFLGYNRPFLYNYGRPFYGPGYGYGYRGYNYGYPFAAGILGFGLGAILGGAINNYGYSGYGYRGYGYGSSHVARCEARFRSYDPGTDSYMGYDGYRHRCNL